jgi:Rho-binding antiterminator
MEYLPIYCGYHDVILAKATEKRYCKIQYFTDIHEFTTVNNMIKDVFTKEKAEFMVLTTGEQIRLDRIVSIDGVFAPQFAHYQDFSCDC